MLMMTTLYVITGHISLMSLIPRSTSFRLGYMYAGFRLLTWAKTTVSGDWNDRLERVWFSDSDGGDGCYVVASVAKWRSCRCALLAPPHSSLLGLPAGLPARWAVSHRDAVSSFLSHWLSVCLGVASSCRQYYVRYVCCLSVSRYRSVFASHRTVAISTCRRNEQA